MKKSNFILAFIAVGLTACAARNSEVNRHGSCSELTVSTYKSVFQRANRYAKEGNTADIVAVHNACVAYATALESGTCKANGPSKKIVEIAYQDLEVICDSANLEIRKQLNEKQEEASDETP